MTSGIHGHCWRSRLLVFSLLVAESCTSDGPAPSTAALAPETTRTADGPPPSLDHLIDQRASCEQLQLDYALIRTNRSLACTSDSDCRCSKGGTVPVRLCGAVDFRTTSKLLDAVNQRFVTIGCRENWCNGRPCAETCSDWRCTAVCREARCENATGANER